MIHTENILTKVVLDEA